MSRIDNREGEGQVPYNCEVDYMGMKVLMKPSVFLNLAHQLNNPKEDSIKYLTEHLESGGKIGAPFLNIYPPEAWGAGDFSENARVSGHEGRHRMLALQAVDGDEPVEVHFFFKSPQINRNRHLTEEIIENLRTALIKEASNEVISGELFLDYENKITSEMKLG